MAAQISAKMRGRGLIPMIAATSIVRVAMKSITVIAIHKGGKKSSDKREKNEEFERIEFDPLGTVKA